MKDMDDEPPPWWEQQKQSLLAEITATVTKVVMTKVTGEMQRLIDEAITEAVSQVTSRVNALDTKIAKVSTKPLPTPPAPSRSNVTNERTPNDHGTTPNEERKDMRKREMVFRGFDSNTPKDEIKGYINNFLKDSDYETTTIVFTIAPMTSFGIVRLQSIEEKIQFKQWLGEKRQTLKAKGIYVSDNVDKDTRIKEIVTGKVAKALHDANGGKKRQDLTVDWRRGVLFLGKEEVARWEEGSMVLKHTEVVKVKGGIRNLLNAVGLEGVEVKEEMRGEKRK